MDLAGEFFFCAKLYPRRPAFMWIGGGVSYAMLAQQTLSAARNIQAAGITKRDIVAIDVKHAPDHGALILALYHLGICATSLEDTRREAVLAAGVNVVIADRHAPLGESRLVRISGQWFEPQPDAPAPGGTGFASLDDVCRIKATSGTTGRAQPVRVTVRDAIEGIDQNRFFEVEGRTLSMFGLPSLGERVMLRALRTGGTVCFAGGPQEACDTIQLCGVERLLASTVQLRELTRYAKQAGEPLHGLKSVLVGGSSISARLIADAQRYVCNNLIVHYASTQAGFVAIAPAAALEGRPGAAGFIVPFVEVEALGDDGKPLPRGQTGELRLRSFRATERAAAARSDAIPAYRDGWFYPGDIGSIEADGMLIVKGRKSELINIGGVKVAPDLVDELLLAQAGIRDAAAFAMMDENGDEALWAVVVSEAPPDVRALIAACREALPGAAPSVILQAQAIPRNAAGKVMRAKLREEVSAAMRRPRTGQV